MNWYRKRAKVDLAYIDAFIIYIDKIIETVPRCDEPQNNDSLKMKEKNKLFFYFYKILY